MTGQVKEDVLNRWAELGVKVKEGQIHFEPLFLSDNEYLIDKGQFEYFTLKGSNEVVDIQKGELAFTYCQTLIVYRQGKGAAIELHYADGKKKKVEGQSLNTEDSDEIFTRSGNIKRLTVTTPNI